MRIAILADIHGNVLALEAVLADLESRKVDGVCQPRRLRIWSDMAARDRRIAYTARLADRLWQS
jgi:hypothetical protein